VAGLMIRRGLPESAPSAPESGRLPIVEAFVTEWRAMLQVIGLTVLQGAAFYLIFVYLVTWLEKSAHLWPEDALGINTLNMVILLAMMPIAGGLSDRLGRKPLLIAGSLGLFLFAWPMFWLMHHPTPWAALTGQAVFAVLSALFMAVVPATMVEAFPSKVRCTAIAVGYNISLGVIGGTVPMVATYLIERTRDDLSPAYYLMAASAVSLVTVLTLRETSRQPLK